MFEATRKGNIYCSETCRKLRHKAKIKAKTVRNRSRRIAAKIEKLAACSFGRYLLKEVRRAGTVQVLHGHTEQSLKDLVALRRQCTASGGYEKGEPKGAYELSHVWPVSSKNQLGLLTAANLVITPKEFNRRHGLKSPVTGYLGASIPRSTLDAKWGVNEEMNSNKVLKLVRSYLGNDFDNWLSGFVITLTQRDQLIKQLTKAGLPKKQLQELKLQQLKALAEEEEVPHFDITRAPENVSDTLVKELKRLALSPALCKALEDLREPEWSLDDLPSRFCGAPEDVAEFQEMLIQQALLCLHGQSHSEMWRDKPILDWVPEPVVVKREEPPQSFLEDDDEYDIL